MSRKVASARSKCCKARCSEAVLDITRECIRLHGAIGFTYEHSLHFFTKRLWAWRDEFGNDAEWNLLLGRHMAKAGADVLIPHMGLTTKGAIGAKTAMLLKVHTSNYAVVGFTSEVRVDELAPLAHDPRWQPGHTDERVGVWTDDYSSLLRVFRWR